MADHPNNAENGHICLDPSKISSARAYHTLNAIVVPRPIALVSTVGRDEVVNVAPFSWFGAVCASPPMISISVARREDGPKDTSRNILESGEFVVNTCSTDMAAAISKAAGDWPTEQSELDIAGFSTIPSERIASPRIREAPVQMECRLHKHLELGDGPLDFLIGEVLLVHVRSDLVDDKGRIDVSRIDPLARLNGDNFARLDPGYFSIPRG